MSESGQTSPVFDNEFIAELLYPLAMKKVIVEAGHDPYKQKDVRIAQSVSITAGVGTLPANAVLECLDTARVRWTGTAASFDGSLDVDTVTDRITVTAHGYQTGLAVQFGAGPPAPLVAGQIYYIAKVSANAFSVCTTRSNAFATVIIDLTETYTKVMNISPLSEADTVSFVPRVADLFRPNFSEFSLWSVDSGNLHFTPYGSALPNSFTGTISLNSVVFPIINSNNIQIVSGTNLAEDIIDDIVRELASAIRQEVAVKAIAA